MMNFAENTVDISSESIQGRMKYNIHDIDRCILGTTLYES